MDLCWPPQRADTISASTEAKAKMARSRYLTRLHSGHRECAGGVGVGKEVEGCEVRRDEMNALDSWRSPMSISINPNMRCFMFFWRRERPLKHDNINMSSSLPSPPGCLCHRLMPHWVWIIFCLFVLVFSIHCGWFYSLARASQSVSHWGIEIRCSSRPMYFFFCVFIYFTTEKKHSICA